MASRTSNFCIDARDPRAQVAWWAQVLDDFEPDSDDSDDSDDELGLRGPAGRWLLFLRVPEGNEFCVLSTRADAAGVARQ